MEQLFSDSIVDERVRESASINVEAQGQIRFLVWVSFLEIYNELVYDLLVPVPKKKNARRPVLQLREDRRGVPYVRGMCYFSNKLILGINRLFICIGIYSI